MIVVCKYMVFGCSDYPNENKVWCFCMRSENLDKEKGQGYWRVRGMKKYYYWEVVVIYPE